MRKTVCARSVVFLVFFVTMIYGCATMTETTSSKGTVRIGMTKSEVLAIWGEPKGKGFLDGDDRLKRYELWDYPRINWWGAHTISLSFDKDGKLVYIEPLYK